jgi:hypothetical protein
MASTLTGVRPLRHADRRLDVEQARGVGDRLAVVPRRGGDQAAGALGLRELRDEVDAAAHLERADRLVVLVLDRDLRADELAEPGVPVERRRPQVGRDPLAGRADVVERGDQHGLPLA